MDKFFENHSMRLANCQPNSCKTYEVYNIQTQMEVSHKHGANAVEGELISSNPNID